MRHRVFAHLDADVAAAHLMRGRGRGTGAEKGVENEVARVGGDVEDALDQAFGFGSLEDFGLSE